MLIFESDCENAFNKRWIEVGQYVWYVYVQYKLHEDINN